VHRFFRNALLVLLVAMMLLQAACASVVYGSLPDERIYVEQPKAHTCTLTAATMLLRNYAFQNGYEYEGITTREVGKLAWSDHGLAQEFAVGSLQVSSDTSLGAAQDKKAWLIEGLRRHPEGFVIYNSRQPHAVFLFGYREDTDTFFCADTTGENKLQMISLNETLLKGEGQQGKIERLTKVWYLH